MIIAEIGGVRPRTAIEGLCEAFLVGIPGLIADRDAERRAAQDTPVKLEPRDPSVNVEGTDQPFAPKLKMAGNVPASSLVGRPPGRMWNSCTRPR